jgi:hypothetical protein
LDETQSHLAQTDNIMVPWGVAHMPDVAKGIQKAGFHLVAVQNYVVSIFMAMARRANEPDMRFN